MKYRHKYIKSGDVIEIYEYGKTISSGKDSSPNRSGRRGNGSSSDKSKNRYDSMLKAKKRLRRLINANVIDESKFITLTFADNVQDLTYANNEFKKFVKRLNYDRNIKLKYSVVVEFQKRGAIHYHMIAYNLPYIENSKLAEIWGQGFVKVNKIDDVDNVGAYVVKYMTKDNTDERLLERKSYFSSRGLNQPEELAFEDVQKIENLREALHSQMVYNNTFENDHVGVVIYQQYNMKRK